MIKRMYEGWCSLGCTQVCYSLTLYCKIEKIGTHVDFLLYELDINHRLVYAQFICKFHTSYTLHIVAAMKVYLVDNLKIIRDLMKI